MNAPPTCVALAFKATGHVNIMSGTQHAFRLMPYMSCCAWALCLPRVTAFCPSSSKYFCSAYGQRQTDHQPSLQQGRQQWREYKPTEIQSTYHSVNQLRLLHVSSFRYAPKRKAASAGAAGAKASTAGAATEAATGSGHVFNIYKAIPEDHKLLPYEAYPPWLLGLEMPEKSYGELAFTFLYGMGIERATLQEYMRFTRLHTKNLIKLNNMRLKKAKRSSVKPIYYDV